MRVDRVGAQPASLGLGWTGIENYTPTKNVKNSSSQKIVQLKKTPIYLMMNTRWWPGTPWPLRFTPICEELHA